MSHLCAYCVVTCIDFRFHPLLQPFYNGKNACDRVSLAGASKALVDDDTRDSVLKQIEISRRLHGIQTVTLIDHEDCGAFGGKKATTSDAQEMQLHKDSLHKAREIIAHTFPHLDVEIKYIQLDGTIVDLK